MKSHLKKIDNSRCTILPSSSWFSLLFLSLSLPSFQHTSTTSSSSSSSTPWVHAFSCCRIIRPHTTRRSMSDSAIFSSQDDFNANMNNNNAIDSGNYDNTFGQMNQGGGGGVGGMNNNMNNNNNNNNMNNENNGYPYGDGGEMARERYKMVKQFNGDYKTVPIDEYYEGEARKNERRSIASEYGVLRATRGGNPNLTSPARELLPKQWEWQRTPPPDMRPRFRQVRTFSGDMKTVREGENPYLDGRVPKNEYGRVDGTGYVPDMGPESMSTLRYAPSRRRQQDGYQGRMAMPPPMPMPRYSQQPQYGRPPPSYSNMPPPPPSAYDRRQRPLPPPPPRRRSRQDRRQSYDSMRRPPDVDPRFVGDELRQMRSYGRDEYGPSNGRRPPSPRRRRRPAPDDNFYEDRNGTADDYYDEKRRSRDPISNLAKEAEKVVKSVTDFGGSKRRERRHRKRDMDYLRRAAAEQDMMYGPPPPPLQQQQGRRGGGGDFDRRYDYDREYSQMMNNNNNNFNGYQMERGAGQYDRDGNFDSSAAVRSFEGSTRGRGGGGQRPPPHGSGPPRPPYESRGGQYRDDRYY